MSTRPVISVDVDDSKARMAQPVKLHVTNSTAARVVVSVNAAAQH